MININGKKLEYFKFPAGEVHFELTDPPEDNSVIDLFYQSNDDLMVFMLLNDMFIDARSRYSLNIPYFPYARQDRKTTPTSPSSFLSIINKMMLNYCTEVRTIDFHNPVVFPNITWSNVITLPNSYNLTVEPKNHGTYLIVPDAGAQKRCEKIAKDYGLKIAYRGQKIRNPSTGQITHYELERLIPIIRPASNFLVFDDICDGGGTFILLAQAFQKTGRCGSELHLVTSHGIYSKGLEELSKYYKTVECVYNTKTMELNL